MAKRHSRVQINGHLYYRRQITLSNGKRKSLYAKTLSELNAKEILLRNSENSKPAPREITVAEYSKLQLSLWKPHISHGTYIGYESKVRQYIISSLIGRMLLSEVTQDDIVYVLNQVAPLSSSSYRAVHMLLRRIFKAAKKSKLIQDDPTEDINSCGGTPKEERPALTDAEVNALLDAIKGLPAETFCRIGIYSGLRREEILALQWKYVHCDVEAPYIEIENAWRIENNRPTISSKLKSKAARRKIPIPPPLANHLSQKQKSTTSDYVICNKDGAPLTGTQWKHLWAQVTRRTASPRKYVRYSNGKKTVHWVIPKVGDHATHNPSVVYSLGFKVTPHQLRYTYITNLIYGGVDIKTVQYLAGHESIRTTLCIYARLKFNQPSQLAGPVNNAFKNLES